MYKKVVFVWIVLIIGSLSIVSLVNYKIDSLQLFNNPAYLKNAAKDVATGNIIGGLKNFDERLFVKNIIDNIGNDIDFIAIGSSRTMQLRTKMLTDDNKSFYNLSVSGASLEDYIGIISYYQIRHGKLPQNIILGIDPWIFNKNNEQDRYLSLYNEYSVFLNDNNITTFSSKKNQNSNLSKIVSFDYLKANTLFLLNYLQNGYYGYYKTNSINKDDYLREPDAAIQYPYDKRNPNKLEVENSAVGYTKGYVYSLEDFEKLDNIELFEYFANYLAKHTNVYIYLPPYNPISYDILIKNDRYKIIAVEDYLRYFVSKNNIQLIGSYNPHKYDLTSSDFFDGMHPLDSAYIKIFQELKKEK